MQKRIFNDTIILLLGVLLIISIAVVSFGYKMYCDNIVQLLRTSVVLAYEDGETPESVHRHISDDISPDIRIAAFDSDNRLIFDSGSKNAEDLTDFLPESGKSITADKMSGIWADTCIYALKCDDMLLVGCKEIRSGLYVILMSVPFIIFAMGLLVVAVTIFSLKLSEKLVAPVKRLVNKIDLFNSNEELNVEYEELEPVLKAVSKLSVRLERYVKKLQKEKERLNLITDNMVEGMLMLDSKNDIILVNKSAVRLLNPQFEGGSGSNVIELTRNQTLIKAIDSMTEQNNISVAIEQNGMYIRAFINRVELENDFGSIVLLVDATESIHAEKIRRDFSANVSHELKTPLTTIKGFGEMFETGMLTESGSILKYGGMIKRESERLIFLINDIIRLSEIEEKSEKYMNEVDLFEIIVSAADILRESALKNNISIDVSGEKTAFVGNESYLRELFINLIDNAVKYNISGGNVKVSLKNEGNEAVAVVEDNGIGISPQDQGRLFERFYRADKSHSKKIGGTGLGLSIVKHIVSYHNGHIELESALNKGTKIIVRLPL